MIGLIELLAIGYALFVAALIAHTAWSLTHPHRKTYAYAIARGRPGDPSELPGAGRPYQSWTFTSRGRSLAVWDVPGDDPAGPAVILTHGWADSRMGGLVRVPALASVASRMILWDVVGHGEAPGASRLGTAEVDDLISLAGVIASPRLVLYGWSLGAGVSIAAGSRCEGVIGIVAEAPYRLAETPARSVMRGFGLPWRQNLRPAMWILGTIFGVGPRWRGFDRAVHAAALKCPLLVIHGELDAVCPIRDAREIAGAAGRGELVEIPGAGHNNLWTEPAFAGACGAAVGGFIAGLAPRSPRPAGTLSA